MRDNLIIKLSPFWIEGFTNGQRGTKDGWVPARPEGYSSILYRLKATWLVFTGRADALVWPGGQ